MFENIAGFESVKEELNRIKEWIKDDKMISDPNVTLPKGILFYGAPGNGKTLFLKEYSRAFDAPILQITGKKTNLCDETSKTFKKTQKNKFSIILIDEIDLLISKSDSIERTIQTEMDGVDSNNRVLVLATTNSLRNIKDPLLRSGRFDRQIAINNPNTKSRKLLFDFYIKKLGFVGKIDTDYLSKVIYGISCADIMCIANDTYLRCGKMAHTEDFEDSFYRITEGEYTPRSKKAVDNLNLEVAYHEVAHALLTYKNKGMFNFYRAYFSSDNNGVSRYYPNENQNTSSTEYCLRLIEVLLAGYIMTKLKFKRFDGGCSSDLQRCRDYAMRLVNKYGFGGPESVLPPFSNYDRMESESRKRMNERLAERIIVKRLKVTKKYLKKHLKEANELVSIMVTKGFIENRDLFEIMEKSNKSSKQSSESFEHNKSLNLISA